ncbi:hypothetical protein [Kribbella italica]|uniref:Uncharacterized protein n=1 Tax=Kribbella italica TaxID=1540520 RepID=A0A7W9MYZ9_9ACTN|nr:hypothetical protein [Kribbella italica]MBB5841364.1 hypothetical protein [Kribbella italica]
MSLTSGGPRREDFFKVPGKGAGAPVKPGEKAPVDRTAALSVGAFQPVIAAVPMPRRLFEHEAERAAALAAGSDGERELKNVVADLDVALTTAVLLLRGVEHAKARERVVEAVPVLVDTAEYKPLDAAAGFLDLDGEDVVEIVDELTDRGYAGPTEEAIAQAEELREQLRQVDHEQLDAFLDSALRIVVLVSIAGAAAPLGALTEGDPKLAEAAKAGVVGLAAVALQELRNSKYEKVETDEVADLTTGLTPPVR